MQLILPKTSVVVFPPKLETLTVVFVDQYDPTQELAFRRVFTKNLVQAGNGIVFVSEADLVRMLVDSHNVAADLKRIFAGQPVTSIILSRYTGHYWKYLLDLGAALEVPVAVFLDDNLLEVPVDIGQAAVDIYAQPNRRQALLQTIAHADVMIASTLALETQLRAYPHRKITHTHIYCSTTEAEVQDVSSSDATVRVGYMASRWHRHDLDYILPVIDDMLAKNDDVVFEVFGFDWDVYLKDKYPNRIVCHPPVPGNYYSFRNRLNRLNWDIGIAPLRPIKYNRCKANTKWIEYTSSGISVVASRLDPYETLPEDCLVLADHNQWYPALDELVRDPAKRRALRARARAYVLERYSIEAHAAQFVGILSDVGGYVRSVN